MTEEEKLPTSVVEWKWNDRDALYDNVHGELTFDIRLRNKREDVEVVSEFVRREDVEELLPVLAHRLWWYWSRHIAEEEDISDSRVERWEELWEPFEELSEEMQGKDRELVQRFFEDDLIDEAGNE